MSQKELAELIAKRFIQRRDVKAVQLKSGFWTPDDFRDPATGEYKYAETHPLGWKMPHLLNHLAGTKTYGHYLLDAENMCRMFAFDIDLEKEGNYYSQPDWSSVPEDADDNWFIDNSELIEKVNPRELWGDRREKAARSWYKYQLRSCAHLLAKRIGELGLPTAVAYSGNKGVHVYGFTAPTAAARVREVAETVLEMTGEFELYKGENFFRHKNEDPVFGLRNLSIEVFPKQTELNEHGYGNLMRLPLGKNLKNPKDPTFFLDMCAPLGEFRPHPDPVKLLATGECFE